LQTVESTQHSACGC